jgi:HEAT repeats
MGKKGRAKIWVAVMAAVAVAAWVMIRAAAGPAQPVYDGKTLGFWLVQLGPGQGTNYDEKHHDEAVVAVQKIGTNAIPFLLRLLQARDSKFKSLFGALDIPGIRLTRAMDLNYRGLLGFQALGPQAAGAVPELIGQLHKGLNEGQVYDLEYALGYIGPAAKAAVPLLAQNAVSTNGTVRGGAIVALGTIHADPEVAVPVLTEELRDTNWPSTLNAAYALGRFGSDAKPAVPTLVDLIQASLKQQRTSNAYAVNRRYWEDALRQIDPEAYARVLKNGVEKN